MRLAGFLAPAVVYLAVGLLHLAIPARWVDAYVIDPRTQRPYRYRLNGTFKRDPGAQFLGWVAPVVLTDGDRKLLVSGFWRVSRHVNYLGEILMATGLTLALGHPRVWTTWLYPLYYVALLVPRQIDDDCRCAEKYGLLWKEYCARVRYRIVPGVY